jgi:Na+/H+ antiporter NhaD/arsenite permease-like protein
VDVVVVLVFVFVYLGMIWGRYPRLALDRTGIAVLGAIALLATGRISLRDAWGAVDISTMTLLLGLMVLSAQFRLSGFYASLTRRVAAAGVSPPVLLALLIGVVGLLSALLVNDIVCLAVAPLLVEGCSRRGLYPLPFLLGLACAANVGSAATLIGNPQNILIGQTLGLSFSGYLLDSCVPSALGLAATWLVICRVFRGKWHRPVPAPVVEAPAFDAWQTAKGLVLLGALVTAFLFAPWPRDVLALAAAGILLLSKRMASRTMLGLVDWHLLLLFAGLFVVNRVLQTSGTLGQMMAGVGSTGVNLAAAGWLFVVTVALSNLVSNVPAVILLLPAATHPLAGPILALASTFAGNLLIVGSIANIIVVEQAERLNLRITWWEHMKVGVPVTAVTLALAAGWLYLRACGLPW